MQKPKTEVFRSEIFRRNNYMKKVYIITVLLFCYILVGCNKNVDSENVVIQKSLISTETDDTRVSKDGNKEQKEDVIISQDTMETVTFIDAWDEWHETTINPKVEKHEYNWFRLKTNGDRKQYVSDDRYYSRKGVDVSSHQGVIDWQAVKEDGYEFAFVRIGFRGYGEEGNLKVDTQAMLNIKNAQEAGLEVGVYLFSQAINETEALEEAQLVIDQLNGYKLQLPVVYDPERIRGKIARTDTITGKQFTKNAIAFCEAVKDAGYKPMIYSNMIWEAFEFDLEELAEYPIWYADYEEIPQTPYKFDFWQYSESGKVDGIQGEVDLDLQFCPRD
jgi:Lyzozyme M1 (1,4-beta-N-acetylmuramidase)